MFKVFTIKNTVKFMGLSALISYGALYFYLNDLADLGNKEDWSKEEVQRVDNYMRTAGHLTKYIPPIGPLRGLNYASKTGFAYLDGKLPSPEFIEFWRDVVLYSPGKGKGDSFKEKLEKHEATALKRYKKNGKKSYEKRIIQRIPMWRYGIPGHDNWSIYIRTDIVDGKPKTDFIVAEMGIVVDKRNHKAFGPQVDNIAGLFGIKGEDMFKWMYKLEEKKLAKPYWIIITGHDITSHFSHKDVYTPKSKKLSRWRKALKLINETNKGKSVHEIYN